MAGICVGNLETAALRALLGSVCFGKAALTVNDSVGQTATVTIGGTKHTDDVITVTLDGVDFEYTVLVTDADLAAVATALAAVVDASDDYAATADGSVVTIVASDTAVPFTGSVAVTGTDATTTATYAVTHVSVQGVETDNAITYCVDGVAVSLAATADVYFSTGGIIPISSFKWYLVYGTAAGALAVIPGETGVAALPDIPAGGAPVGCFKVVTDATHTFTPGTTALNATGITTTYYDLAVMPTAGIAA